MLKVGLVGIGGMGFVHYNAYKKIEGAEVVAVADVRTDMAKEKEIYSIHMNGSVSKLSKNSRKEITPGCEIVVPAKRVSKKMSTAEVVSITTATATLATMVVTLISVLK